VTGPGIEQIGLQIFNSLARGGIQALVIPAGFAPDPTAVDEILCHGDCIIPSARQNLHQKT
jgi:hypothetical protein